MKGLQHNTKGQGMSISALGKILLMVLVVVLVGLFISGKFSWTNDFLGREADFDLTINGKIYNVAKYMDDCPLDKDGDEKYYDFRDELFVARKYKGAIEKVFNKTDLQEMAIDYHSSPRISKTDYETIQEHFNEDIRSYTLYSVELINPPSAHCLTEGKECTFAQFSLDYFGEAYQSDLTEQCKITPEEAKERIKEQRAMEREREIEQAIS